MATTQQTNKALVSHFIEDVVAGGDFDAIEVFLADDVTDHNAVFGEFHGREHVREGGRAVRTAFDDFTVAVEELIAEGDLVAVRATVSGIHVGPVMDFEPTGEPFEIDYVWFYRIEDEQIVELWSMPDGLGLVKQLSRGEGG